MRRVVLSLFLGGCTFCGSFLAVHWAGWLEARAKAQVQPGANPSAAGHELISLSDSFEAVARRAGPGVVAVEATKPPAAGAKSRSVEESGSGFLVRLEGVRQYLVLTNNHVVANAKPDQITVSLADGRVFRPGHVWADPESDLAVLRLDGDGPLPTVFLGDSDRVRVGQWVLAIGSPFGLNQSVTHGIISARERGQVSLGSTIRIKDFLQTDAAINPGSSGGPLLNMDGEVIGINTAIASQNGSNSGVAFSIPINLAKRVLRQLVDKGSVARGYLGMQLAGTFEANDALKLGLTRVQGALVEAVFPETPAADAGLRAQDVVLQVDGVAIRNENHLINMISGFSVGQKVQLQVWRERKQLALEALVGDWTKAQTRFRADQ